MTSPLVEIKGQYDEKWDWDDSRGGNVQTLQLESAKGRP